SVDVDAVEGADYHTALRKIDRMRGPIAVAATRMRARFDPEYCGVRLPDVEESGLEEALLDDDLSFLQAPAELERELEGERQRIARDMARLARLVETRGFDREKLRAAACAYVADMRGVRSLLSAREIMSEVYERAAQGDLAPAPLLPRFRLHRRFKKYWRAHGKESGYAYRAAWRATVHNVDGAANALRAWHERGESGRDEGERILAELLRHPERISEQIVTLRAVQTLALIDVLNYRSHVYTVGGYASDGDSTGDALNLP
ncbi:MAG: hypothetical protein OER88_03435, partial [Planctomycetota bacterium]|nr:hypothetical protein [Planctomycetota bacterium]